MKRAVLLLMLVIVLVAGCTQVFDFIFGFVPEEYDDLLGSWTVVSRPEGWVDTRFEFTTDRTYHIYYDNEYWTDQSPDPVILGLTADVVSVSDIEFTTRLESSLLTESPTRETWVYRFVGTDTNTIQIGLYNDETGDPEYHWEAIRD